MEMVIHNLIIFIIFCKTMKCIANTNQARLLLQIEGSLIESLLTLLLFNILLV